MTHNRNDSFIQILLLMPEYYFGKVPRFLKKNFVGIDKKSTLAIFSSAFFVTKPVT